MGTHTEQYFWLTYICTCWMNSDPIQYPIPIPGWGIEINLLGELWPNPIPNSNTRVPIPNNIFDCHMYMLDELRPNPIANSNSRVGYWNQSIMYFERTKDRLVSFPAVSFVKDDWIACINYHITGNFSKLFLLWPNQTKSLLDPFFSWNNRLSSYQH